MPQFHVLFSSSFFNLDKFGLYCQAKSYQTIRPNERLKREEKFSYRAEKYKHTQKKKRWIDKLIYWKESDRRDSFSQYYYIYINIYIYLKSISNYNYIDTNEESKGFNETKRAGLVVSFT